MTEQQQTTPEATPTTPTATPTTTAAVPPTATTTVAVVAAEAKPGEKVPQAGSFFSTGSLYVGDLRPEVAESQLFDIFKTIGPISSIRVCRDASRRSLGYAYVNFVNPSDAERAIVQLNFTSIGGKPCRIMWSFRDPSRRKSGVGNLFVKNLDKAVDNQALYELFTEFGNILSCKVETDEKGASKRYGYVHYDSEEAANRAIEKMNNKPVHEKPIFVGKFVSHKDRNSDVLKEQKFTNVYVKNLDPVITTEQLQAAFAKYGDITSCVVMATAGDASRTGHSRGFGFVNFQNHESAVQAVNEMNNTTMGSKAITVVRAQTRTERQAFFRHNYDSTTPGTTTTPAATKKPGGMNLYVKNLDDSVTDESLRQMFEHCGTITSSKVMLEGKTSTSKGFGFVCFSTPDEAAKAVTEMNGVMVRGKPIYVALAQKKEQRRAQLAEQYARNTMLYNNAMRAYPPTAPHNPLQGAPGMYPQVYYPNFPSASRLYPQQMMVRPQLQLLQQQQLQQQQQQQQQQPGQRWTPNVRNGGQPGVPMYGVPTGVPGAVRPARVGGPAPTQGRRPQMMQGHKEAGQPTPQQQQQQPQGAWSQRNLKFTPTTRNQPGGAYMQQQVLPLAVPANQLPPPQPQIPQEAPQAAPVVDEDQKQIVGEQLYAQVQAVLPPALCGKITGMLLESLGVVEVQALLSDQAMMLKRINEAHAVYEAHMKKVEEQMNQ